MKRTVTTAMLTTSTMLASLSVALGANFPNRHCVSAQPCDKVELRITSSNDTWFTGSNAQGDKMTVVFLPRFASVVRDGTRVPISFLKPGDTVQVVGRLRNHRIAADSARLTQQIVRTPGTSVAP